MATSKNTSDSTGAANLVDSIEDIEQSTLAAVRRFIDNVDGALPALSDDRPRTKIIDSAFEMVEQLVGASNNFTRKMFDAAEEQVGARKGSKSDS